MQEQLFDRATEYEAMLNQGISLSGENQEFFILGRIRDMRTQARLRARWKAAIVALEGVLE